jgi:hypothetical protein
MHCVTSLTLLESELEFRARISSSNSELESELDSELESLAQ